MIHRGAASPRDLGPRTATPDGRPPEAQPKWRQDFPVDWAEDEYVSRRDLVKFIVLTSGAFAVGQFWIVWKSLFGRRREAAPRLAIATVDELPVGGAKTFSYPSGSPPRLLVRVGKREFVAYDQQCTHLLCPVVPDVPSGRIHCPCHNGWFDLATGQVLAGPPTRPLARVVVEVRDGAVWATGMEGAT